MATPRISRLLVARVVPIGAVAVALVLLFSPNLLTSDQNQAVKQSAELLKRRISEGAPVPYFGGQYWEIANPLLYYAERLLAQPTPSALDAVTAASNHPDRLLVVDRDRISEFEVLGKQTNTVLDGTGWVLLTVFP